jgi:predicted glycoside hydrolase/deacetylase ChbG (UPF0249 family)
VQNQISADDWGISPAVNRGILKLARDGIVEKVSILVDGEFTQMGLDHLKKLPGVVLGLHFNLTYRTRFNSPLGLLVALLNPFTRKNTLAWVENEFKRQVSKMRELGIPVTHFDGHHHAHVFPFIAQRIAKTAVQEGFREVRMPWDPKLRWTSKFPLEFFTSRSRPHYQECGLHSLACFYPKASDFKNKEVLLHKLYERVGHEVIVHPADEDDFGQVGCPDPYRAGRIREYQTLSQLGPSLARSAET